MNSSKISQSVSADALYALERDLAAPAFMGVPIGSTLGHYLIIEFFVGLGDWSAKAFAVNWLRYLYRWLFPIHVEGKPASLSLKENRFLLTWLQDRPNFNSLIFPLIKVLGSEHCNVVGMSTSMRDKLPSAVGFLTWKDVPFISSQWRSEYRRCRQSWLRLIHEWVRKHDLPIAVVPRLAYLTLLQSQRVVICYRMLKNLKPSIVITEFDRNSHDAPLVLAAKALSIPTVTMVHGAIHPQYGYTPVLADKILCWGNLQHQQLISLGVQPGRIVKSGHQGLSRALNVVTTMARAKIGVPVERSLVLLVTNPIKEDLRKQYVVAFCRAFAKDNSVTAAVRLHPSERLAFYATEIAAYPTIYFTENHDWTLEESLAAADVVISRDSTLGIEALVKRVPVIIFDVLPIPLTTGRMLIENAGCLHCSTPDDLACTVQQVLTDYSLKQKLLEKSDRFVGLMYDSFGDVAAERAAKAIRELVELK